eukprot:3045570-Rhodomonas_salina.1
MSSAHPVRRKEYKQSTSHLATHVEPTRLATDDGSTCPLKAARGVTPYSPSSGREWSGTPESTHKTTNGNLKP